LPQNLGKKASRNLGAVHTDFSSYPKWSRFILSIGGEVRKDARLSVRMDDGGGVMTVSPEILVREAPAELRWRGVLGAPFLFSAEHYFRLERSSAGTRLIHGEIFGGLLVPLFWKQLDGSTSRAFGDFDAALCKRAESGEER
jgi:hypothetical protein